MTRRFLAALGVLSVGVMLSAVHAQPASAASPSCTYDRSYNNNSLAVRCASGPGTSFSAYILCTNAGGYRFGPERGYGTGVYSAVGCSGTATITEYGIYANNRAYRGY